ncbi:MAG: TonB-dependent receptor [Bryobacteraceae bacterium]
MSRCFIPAALFAAGALLAQTGAGRIQGTVKDPSGAVIPSANVAAEHVETGVAVRTVTNQAGFFLFPSAQTGRYRIAVEAPGLERWQGELLLQTGQEAEITPVLAVGATSTQIVVAGDITPLLTTTSPTLATVVERERIEELPLNGRFFQNLVSQTTPGLEGNASAPKAYGLRDGSLQFVQDGASISDANITQLTTRPPGLDTIQEYRVEMSVASARFTAPATTLLSTRSGTNQLHGSLFYTGRNNGFGLARRREDFYTKPPQLIRNEYGASVGGPVRLPHLYNGKDRTFFFFAWEAYGLRNASTMNSSLPTQAMQRGDFRELTDGQSRAITLYDPWTTAGPDQKYARVPFTGNVIPLSRRSPFAAYFFSVMPQPNQPGVNPSIASNWFGPDSTRQTDWTNSVRIDHRFGNNDQVFGRYTIGNRILVNRRPNQPMPMSLDKLWNSQDSSERMQSGSFTWNHTFTPSFFVETVFTGARMDWKFSFDQPAVGVDLSPKLGFPNPFGVAGAPSLTNIGFAMQGTGLIPRAEDTKPIAGEQIYTVVRGRHQFEFGWRLERMMLDVLPDRPGAAAINFASQATGVYDPATGTAYNAVPRTGDNLANFFIGVAGSYSQTLPAPSYVMRSSRAAGYVQDNWKIASNLTLNLGLRYEYLPPLLDRNGINAVFDFPNHAIARTASLAELIGLGATTQAFVNSYTAIGVKFETTREAGFPDSLVHVPQRNFSPRVGFAWQGKLGTRPLVLRGGYGQFRFPLGTRLFNVQRGNPPLQGTVSYNINSAAQSPDGFANYGLRSAPTVIAGTSSAIGAIKPDAVNAIPRGVGINAFAPTLDTPLAREWNLTFETEVIRNTLLRVAYVGTAARHLEQDVQKNGQPNNYVHYVTTGQPLPSGAYAAVARRNYDQTTYGDIHVYSSTGYSNFNGLQVEVQRRFSRGLGFQWFYVMSNALWVGSGSQILGTSSLVPDPVTFMPGSVPADFDAYNRFYNYQRDTGVPKHRINWNLLYDLPFGRGKKLFSRSGRLLDRIVGGWQLASYSSMSTRWIALPETDWGATGKIQIYGKQYPIQDCRSGTCFDGYLYYNGYIPANQVNSRNAQGQPNGVMGVPSNYQPSHQPIWPTPANLSPSDPNYSLYGTNIVFVPLKNGTQQRIAFDNGLNPLRNQAILGPWTWAVNSSLFKVIPITERVRLRLNMDAFNVFNMPGTPMPNAATGILLLRTSSNGPRQLQWTLRLTF